MQSGNQTIKMVDLKRQYLAIKPEMDAAMQQVLESTSFIGGPVVERFAGQLSQYLGGCHVVTCANGTDALQLALMALGLQRGDEVIVPAFTYVASAEAVALLGLTPVLVDVDPRTFNLTAETIRQGLSPRTKAVIPVHLFGQSCDMEPILQLAREYNLFVIEDNAQAIGAEYTFSDGHTAKTGTMGDIGCTSFFPSKNLGCYGDGGALTTADPQLAERLRMLANHGQRVKYHHAVIGCNSRLDALQAAVLEVKLRHLEAYNEARRAAARYYTEHLQQVAGVDCPAELCGKHVFHQYTLTVHDGRRDALKDYLAEQRIPSMIYYPLPLQQQEAFKGIAHRVGSLDNATRCAESVLSIPMHTELAEQEQEFIVNNIRDFFTHGR